MGAVSYFPVGQSHSCAVRVERDRRGSMSGCRFWNIDLPEHKGQAADCEGH